MISWWRNEKTLSFVDADAEPEPMKAPNKNKLIYK
jgi:hypothetical protein